MAHVTHAYWQDLKTTDFDAMDRETTVVLLPVSAIEQHGPHLPLGTDWFINEAILQRAIDHISVPARVLILPSQAVGHSGEHIAFAGTLSHEAETLIAAWTEIGADVARTGLRKLVIFNSHGGQSHVVDIVAGRLRRAHGMLVIRTNSFRLGPPPGLFDEWEAAHGIHGGAIETSMMLHLRPELVEMEKAARFVPYSEHMERQMAIVRADRPVGFGWQSEDLHAAGAAGDAAAADAEKGRIAIHDMAKKLALVIDDAARFPLAKLGNAP